MSTFIELVNQVENNLQGYSLDQDQLTFITANIGSGDTTFTVDEINNVTRGLIQVDDELMWVKQVNSQTSQVTISPFGRGYKATTAASHAANAQVSDNPKFPRARIRETMNTCIRDMYPDLYAVKSYEFPYVAARSTYAIPADATQIHSINWQTIGPSLVWSPINRYKYTALADTTAFATGKSVDILTPVIPGRTIKVDYIAPPSVLVNDSDDFTVSGLDLTAQEACIYGTCYRLAGWLEPPRLQTTSIETTLRSTIVPPKSATDLAQFFYGLYQNALMRARDKLLKENPPSKHFRYV
jgi:hypothetical protein